MDGDRVIGLMAVDTERGVEDVAVTRGRVIDMEVGRWRRLIPVAVQAIYLADIGRIGMA